MTIEEAKAKLQRRLMVAQTPPLDPTLVDTIAALLVDVANEAYTESHTDGVIDCMTDYASKSMNLA